MRISKMNTATITFDKTIGKYVATYKGTVIAKSPTVAYLEKVICQGHNKKAQSLKVTKIQLDESIANIPHAGLQTGDLPIAEVVEKPEFSVDERFEFVEEFTEMVADKVIPSVILVGEGGIGKTYTVTKTLRNKGLQPMKLVPRQVPKPNKETGEIEVDDDGNPVMMEVMVEEGDYKVVKGFSTARAMFRTLWENNDRTILFDDCDSIQKDETAVNLLKAALDSYDERIVSWNSENPFSDLPRSFRFRGQIIFISNLSLEKLNQAVRTRSTCVDLSMTDVEKIERMETIIRDEEFLPEFEFAAKRDALDFINDNLKQARNLSLRTLIQITKIRATTRPNKWNRLALYALVNG